MDKQVTVNFSPKTVFVIAASVILIWVAFFLRDILVLFLLSFVIAIGLKPLVDFLEKKKVPRFVSVLVLLLLVISSIYILIRLIIPPITIQVEQIIQNRHEIGLRLNSYLSTAPVGVKNLITDYTTNLPDKLARYTSGSMALNVLGVFSGLLGFITVLVISFYLLLEKGSFEDVIEKNWIWGSKERAKRIFRKISLKVSLWMRGQLLLSGSIGILTFVGLSVLGIPYALTLSLVAALSELLPLVGPFLGAIPAVLIAFTISPIMALWVALLYLLIQQFESQLLAPQIMKRVVGLSAVTTIFALLVGAKLLGILGVLMAVPVASSIMVIIEELRKKEK